MPAFNKFQSFVEAIGREVHNLHTDTLKVMLTNVAPVATNTQKSNLTEITPGAGYSAGGATVASTSYSHTTGTAKLVGNDVTITADAGSIGPFRYAVLYNDTASNDELIGWWDYTSSLTLADGESVTIDFDGDNGILTIV
jgi:hypothetical protein